jgi:hypothetical protein
MKSDGSIKIIEKCNNECWEINKDVIDSCKPFEAYADIVENFKKQCKIPSPN